MTLVKKHHEEEIKTRIAPYLEKAHAIQFDGCHKIYILRSSESMWGEPKVSDEICEPSIIVLSNKFTTNDAAMRIVHWFKESCPLVFISYIENDGTSNYDYTSIIEQGDNMFDDLYENDEDLLID